jgi:hypothetical protein
MSLAGMETYANGFRKEIRDFISVSERIQSIVAQGEALTTDEAGVVRLCAAELLAKVPEPI